MNDSLAEALLGKVMGWDSVDIETSIALLDLQMLARYKYDGYQRFRPGRKFVESLADWLLQFKTISQRETALNFVRKRLTYISNVEMEQLVRILYPEVIRPIIRDHVGKKTGLPEYWITKIENHPQFTETRLRSLFLGLSDGARIDEFRRSNRDLSTEQVYSTYEVSEPRLVEMGSKLLDVQQEECADASQFELVFLIDDFAGSGKTILRKTNGEFLGRLKRFSDLLISDQKAEHSVFAGSDTEIHICLYVATQTAIENLNGLMKDFDKLAAWSQSPKIHYVQLLQDQMMIDRVADPAFCGLLDSYYDDAIEDQAKQVGGNSSKFGFAGCALPLVLSHNTPNNSVSLLWAPSPMKALFPRFERHVEPKA